MRQWPCQHGLTLVWLHLQWFESIAGSEDKLSVSQLQRALELTGLKINLNTAAHIIRWAVGEPQPRHCRSCCKCTSSNHTHSVVHD
jgi:hypothetical protein